MAIDIKDALYHFGMITGQVTNDELLGNIFANFCIGKEVIYDTGYKIGHDPYDWCCYFEL
jgi:hypothetical protein